MNFTDVIKEFIERANKETYELEGNLNIEMEDFESVNSLDFNAVNGYIRLTFEPSPTCFDINAHVSSYDKGEAIKQFVSCQVIDGVLQILPIKDKINRLYLNIKLPVKKFEKIKLFSKNGDIIVKDGVTNNLNVETKNGRVDLLDLKTSVVDVKTKHGTVSIDNIVFLGDEGILSCATANSDIIIMLSDNEKKDTSIYGCAKTKNGIVNVNIPNIVCRQSNEDEFKFERDLTKQKSVKVNLDTKNGNIEIK